MTRQMTLKLCLLASFITLASQVRAQEEIKIFQRIEIDDTIDLEKLVGRKAVSAELVIPNFDGINVLKKGEQTAFFNIKNVGNVGLSITRQSAKDEANRSWAGELTGEAGGQFVLRYLQQFRVDDNDQARSVTTISGSFFLNNGETYYLAPYEANGLYALRRANRNRVSTDEIRPLSPSSLIGLEQALQKGTKKKSKPNQDSKKKAKPKKKETDDDHINILILYTNLAANGNPTQAENDAQAMVDQFNTVLSNSSVKETATLIHVQNVTYSEHGKSLKTILFDLALGNVISNIHGFRSSHKADLVCLLVDKRNGLSFRMEKHWDMASKYYIAGFSVVDIEDGIDLRFVHEMGHHFGCCHESCTLGSSGNGNPLFNHIYPKAYEFVVAPAPPTGQSAQKKWITVMGDKTVALQSRSRSLHFSNPLVKDNRGTPPRKTGFVNV